ncbi:OprD family outer membrane porin [Flavobacteriaceae bacterium KMM 6897]|nr:OprD family outer membrane porin [Flavobacteriaceae bacterium KMM 6897]
MKFAPTLNCLLFLIPIFAFSQEPVETKNKGTLSGQWRTYYMNTFNKGNLKDFSALASGGKIKYEFLFHKKWEIGAALYNSTNLEIQDLTVPDETTGKLSRYEEGLFNRLDLKNDALFLLGELYLKYKSPKHEFAIGRMKINTPLINPEDGRMIPTLVQGLWYRYKKTKENTLQLGILNKIAPRSTGHFYDIGESIGTYPEGRSITGENNQYGGNTDSDYVILFNSEIKVTEHLRLDFWNFYVDNISNTTYLKPRMDITQKLNLELEWLHQNKIGNGGNDIDSQRYFSNNTSDILGVKLDYQWMKSKASLAYDRILPHGQFISPREWGREDLFSFQKRERSEGSGDNHALVFHYDTNFNFTKINTQIQSVFSIGRHWKPSVLDPRLNKYAVPDYTQFNLDLFFKFDKLKNLHPELLLVSKIANGDFPNNPNFYFNKTDLFHIDLILNYNF